MDETALYAVVSRTEIQRGWGKRPNSIDMAFWKGKLIGRRVDDRGSMVYTLNSVIALWGQPKRSPFNENKV